MKALITFDRARLRALENKTRDNLKRLPIAKMMSAPVLETIAAIKKRITKNSVTAYMNGKQLGTAIYRKTIKKAGGIDKIKKSENAAPGVRPTVQDAELILTRRLQNTLQYWKEAREISILESRIFGSDQSTAVNSVQVEHIHAAAINSITKAVLAYIGHMNYVGWIAGMDAGEKNG